MAAAAAAAASCCSTAAASAASAAQSGANEPDKEAFFSLDTTAGKKGELASGVINPLEPLQSRSEGRREFFP